VKWTLQETAASPSAKCAWGRPQNTWGSLSPSATLGEEPPVMPLTGKRSSPSAKNRTLGEVFPECRPSTRGRFDAVLFFLKNLFPECNTQGRNLIFLKKIFFPESPISSTRGRVCPLFKKNFPECPCLGTRGSLFFFLFLVTNKAYIQHIYKSTSI
jgi:hypothetical protein